MNMWKFWMTSRKTETNENIQKRRIRFKKFKNSFAFVPYLPIFCSIFMQNRMEFKIQNYSYVGHAIWSFFTSSNFPLTILYVKLSGYAPKWISSRIITLLLPFLLRIFTKLYKTKIRFIQINRDVKRDV